MDRVSYYVPMEKLAFPGPSRIERREQEVFIRQPVPAFRLGVKRCYTNRSLEAS